MGLWFTTNWKPVFSGHFSLKPNLQTTHKAVMRHLFKQVEYNNILLIWGIHCTVYIKLSTLRSLSSLPRRKICVARWWRFVGVFWQEHIRVEFVLHVHTHPKPRHSARTCKSQLNCVWLVNEAQVRERARARARAGWMSLNSTEAERMWTFSAFKHDQFYPSFWDFITWYNISLLYHLF